MTDKEILKEILDTITAIKMQGSNNIATDKLIDYLKGFENSLENKESLPEESLRLAHYKATCELQRETFKAQNESNLEMFRSVIASGQNALRAGFLINGGAVIAILAFIGNCYGKPKIFHCAGLVEALLFFALGVLAIGLATAGTYITQQVYYAAITQQAHYATYKKRGDILNIIVFAFGIISAILFCVGTSYAYVTLKSFVLYTASTN
ncbi:MAG: hypothetical protein WC721_19785 [Victivallaceae bacterium]|jgi:hypothetical protein